MKRLRSINNVYLDTLIKLILQVRIEPYNYFSGVITNEGVRYFFSKEEESEKECEVFFSLEYKKSVKDCYAFGMEMLGSQNITKTNPQSGRVYHNPRFQNGEYRFGFNGKEKDTDFHEDITNYDYGFRIYNPGIARFLSVDPLTRDYPHYTPYQFAGNTPIAAVDLDGLEEMKAFTEESQRFLSNYISMTYKEEVLFQAACQSFMSCIDPKIKIHIVKEDGTMWAYGSDGVTISGEKLIEGMDRAIWYKVSENANSVYDEERGYYENQIHIIESTGITPEEFKKRKEEGYFDIIIVAEDFKTLTHELYLHVEDLLDRVDDVSQTDEHEYGHGENAYKGGLSKYYSPSDSDIDPASPLGVLFKLIDSAIK